jgi:hypothetical protein
MDKATLIGKLNQTPFHKRLQISFLMIFLSTYSLFRFGEVWGQVGISLVEMLKENDIDLSVEIDD